MVLKLLRLVIPREGQGMPRKKIFLSELEGLLPNTWLDNIESNDDGNFDLGDLLKITGTFNIDTIEFDNKITSNTNN